MTELITEVVHGELSQYYLFGEYVVRRVGSAVGARPSNVPALRVPASLTAWRLARVLMRLSMATAGTSLAKRRWKPSRLRRPAS